MNRIIILFVCICSICIMGGEIAYIENLRNDVYLKSFNDSISIDRGYIITDMDTLRTGYMSNAIIAMADRSAVFFIMPQSLFTIRAQVFDDYSLNRIVLFEGSIYANMKKGNYSISAQKTVASLSKGIYYFSSTGDSAFIKCYEGEADIQNEEGNIIISANQSSEAFKGQMPYRMPLTDSLNWNSLISMESDTLLVEMKDIEGRIHYMEIIIE